MMYMTSSDPKVTEASIQLLLRALSNEIEHDLQSLNEALRQGLVDISPSLSHLSQSQFELLHNFCRSIVPDFVPPESS